MDDRRLRRWLDGEMTVAEAEAFLAALSPPDRREAEALATLARAAARLPAAAPSGDFGARTMARIRSRRPPRRSLWTWLRAPALSPLGALAGAALVAVCALGAAEWRAGVLAGRGQVAARLAYRSPLAREVAVAGDFNGWRPEAAPMHRGPGGLWTVDIPLAAGRRYQYMFVVDGRWVTDPGAPATVDDGYGGRNAVLDL
jgi:hypothetical protein